MAGAASPCYYYPFNYIKYFYLQDIELLDRLNSYKKTIYVELNDILSTSYLVDKAHRQNSTNCQTTTKFSTYIS